MTTALRTTLVGALFLGVTTTAKPVYADWNLPLNLSSGSSKTTLTIGIAARATDGYDTGIDAPTPFAGETLDAAFIHPEWDVNVAGSTVGRFHRDIRGTLPQQYTLQVTATREVSITWDNAHLEDKKNYSLHDSVSNTWVDLRKATTYTFGGASTPRTLTIAVTEGDLIPPSAPTGASIEQRASSLYVTWAENTDPDLAGYKVHVDGESGTDSRIIDVRNVQNLNLFNLEPNISYTISVSAYDTTGNQSATTNAGIGMITSTSGGSIPENIMLTVTRDQDGSGVGSISVSGQGICAGSCAYGVPKGTVVTLFPAPDALSSFTGWNGCDSVSGLICTVTPWTARMVVAIFETTAPVRLDGMPNRYFLTLLDAYRNAASGGVIRARQRVFDEGFTFDRNVAVTVKGGHDIRFGTILGQSILKGVVTIKSGSVTFDDFVIN